MVSPHDDPITLVSSRHDEWRREFERERERIVNVLEQTGLDGEVRRVDHVGSTAVPDLPAKDIVDLDIVVEDEAVSEVSRVVATDLGGTRHENTPGWHPVFREADGQRFNDHVFGVSDSGWKVSVVTAEVLRERPDLRQEYAELKREQASETDDLETYSKAKTAFVKRLLDAARNQPDLEFGFETPSNM